MDPNAALSRIQDALEHDDLTEAREAAASLRGWLAAGGFAPTWSRYKKAARWFKERQHNPDDDAAEQDAIDERESNKRHNAKPQRSIAWALAEVWGELTGRQMSDLLAALERHDESAIEHIARAWRQAGHRGLYEEGAEAFALLVREARSA